MIICISAGSAEQRRKNWLSKINGKSVQPRERIEEVKESCNKCPKLEEKAKKLEKKANKLKKEVNKQIEEVTVLKKQLQESQQTVHTLKGGFKIILFPSTFSFSFFLCLQMCL